MDELEKGKKKKKGMWDTVTSRLGEELRLLRQSKSAFANVENARAQVAASRKSGKK